MRYGRKAEDLRYEVAGEAAADGAVAEALIEGGGLGVGLPDVELDGGNTALGGQVFGRGHQAPADALAAIFGQNGQFVDVEVVARPVDGIVQAG